MTSDSDFLEVVPAMSFAAADEAFSRWLSESGLHRSDLRDDDIRIDTVRGLDGRSLRRYLVREIGPPTPDSGC